MISQAWFCDSPGLVSYRDVAGTASLVVALEDAGRVCCSGEVDGTLSYYGEVYFEGGLGGYPED